MVTVVRPSATDWFEALGANGQPIQVRGQAHFAQLARQVTFPAAITIRADDGRLCLMAGLYPTGRDAAEAWFAPGTGLRANLVASLRAWLRLFDDIGAQAAPLTVSAFLHPAGVAGHRLAPLFGFVARGQLAGLQHWERRFD